MSVDQIQGERPMPEVGSSGAFRMSQKNINGLLLLVVAVIAGFWVWNRAEEKKAVAAAEVEEELNPIRNRGSEPRLLIVPEDPEPEPVIAIPQPVAYDPPPPPPSATRPAARRAYVPPKVVKINKSASGSSVAKSSGESRYEQTGQATAQAIPPDGSGAVNGKPANATTGSQNGSSSIETAIASQLENRDKLITAGTFGECVLGGDIITDVAGMAICMTTYDIKSSDGRNVLLPKASKVIGKYNSETTQGIRRIDVQWARIETPLGVVIDIDSPATGPLGATGIAAMVDNHLSERIVGALLLSFIDIAVNEATSGGNNTADVVIGGGVSATGSLARDIFKETAGIKSTLYSPRAATVGFIFMRDLDFSKVSNVR